jgi:uncharacterized protein
MFIDFFLLLKSNGLPVSIREHLTLLEALKAGEAEFSLEEFYYLARTTLVKKEQHFDRFDMLFGHYFKDMELIPNQLLRDIPEEWLRKNLEKFLTEEEKAMIEAMGGLEALMERFKQLQEEQHERHEGGNKWIGTGGTSPFGAYGYNPEGFRIGQMGSRHRRAIKVWDQRQFRNLSDEVELNTRNIKVALRRLRILSREGVAEELDLDSTIRKTSENAGLLDLQLVPSKRNRVKVLIFFDIGGSMDDHIRECEELFSAARHQFKHLEYFYFHNCLYETVWKDNNRRMSDRIPTLEVLNKYNKDYRVIVVGDASMSPYEITYQGGSVEHYNDEAGVVWLQRLRQQFPHIAWLNPVPRDHWGYTQSIKILEQIFEEQMFPLTIAGLGDAMKALMKKQ